MSTRHPEQPIDPPDAGMSDAEQRDLDARAARGFDERDERSQDWVSDLLTDTAPELACVVNTVLFPGPSARRRGIDLSAIIARIRDRYVSECWSEYQGDAIDEAEYTMEDR